MSDSASYLAFVASVPRLRAAAGALLRDREGRVLVVHPVYKDEWDIPGGMIEAGESPPTLCSVNCRRSWASHRRWAGSPVSTGCHPHRPGTPG